MTVTRMLWLAGTMLTALAMLAASATSAAPDPEGSQSHGPGPVADVSAP